MGYILGLGGPYYHDASACLVDSEGTVLAFAEEERFTRRKHNIDSRSCSKAAAFCLSHAGIGLADVDEIAVAWNPEWPTPADHITGPGLIRDLLDPRYFHGRTPDRLTIIEHHLAHAASAFYPSGFPDAAVLVVDGCGDGVSTSLYHGTARGLQCLRQYSFTQSLGWFYGTIAEHLGLGNWTSSGKLMGLAAYGRPAYELSFLRPVEDGYELDLDRYGLSSSTGSPDGYSHLSYYHDLKRAYALALDDAGVSAHRRGPRYDRKTGRYLADTAFTQQHADLAASAQHVLTECLLALARNVLQQTSSTRLCVAGGVGLNCAANGALHHGTGASDMFVQPASGDSGCALGAALECAQRSGALSTPRQVHVALGPEFTDAAIQSTLDAYQIRYTYHGDDIAEATAKALASGATVGWFQGAAEAGPRALGNRSILADPRDVATRDRINRDIKRREVWRPLAPSVLDLDNRWIDRPGSADFMIVAYQASEFAHSTIPATVHVDGSVRPQHVRSDIHPRYARLLHAFEGETGVPVLLNTSFNHEAEPMVCSPTDAIRTFYSTPLDALSLGGFLVTKSNDYEHG